VDFGEKLPIAKLIVGPKPPAAHPILDGFSNPQTAHLIRDLLEMSLKSLFEA
jgi:hypothetical protein